MSAAEGDAPAKTTAAEDGAPEAPAAAAPAAAPPPAAAASAVLRIAFSPVSFPVAADGLHQVMAAYGPVLKVHIADDSASALVRYAEPAAAATALAALQGFALYGDGNNAMTLEAAAPDFDFAVKRSERSKEFGGAGAGAGGAGRAAAPAFVPTGDAPLPLTGDDWVRAHERAMEAVGFAVQRPGRGGGGSGGGPRFGGGNPYYQPPQQQGWGPPGGGGGGWGGGPPGGYGGPPGGGYGGGYGGYGGGHPGGYGGPPQQSGWGPPPQQWGGAPPQGGYPPQ